MRTQSPGEREQRKPDIGSTVDATALETDLQQRIQGEVRFDAGSRSLYATDASNYRQVPIGVVVPRTADDVVETVAVCHRHGAPVLPRGGGTSLAGQCCNVAVVIDCSKYLNNIVALDADARRARVQPGLILDDLRMAAERHQLTFGPDPATHNHCTLGGMIGNNSCGVHSVMAGKTDDNVEELEVLTYDGLRLRLGLTSDDELERVIAAGGRRGEIYSRLRAFRDRYAEAIRARFPKIPRRVSGYNLEQLLPENGFHLGRALVGSEGTCVTVLEATVRLVSSPAARSLLVLGYPDVYEAADHIMDILAFRPIGLEGMDEMLVDGMKKKHLHPQDVKLLPDGKGWLLVEFGGDTKRDADDRARALMAALGKGARAPTMKLFDDPAAEKTIWRVRESGLGATARVPGEPDTWEGWEDSAAPPERLGDYLRDFRKLLTRYGYRGALYGHFGQGCVHTRINFDLVTADGIARFRSFLHAAADLVVSYGGSLSGEHGDGQSRAELLPKMFGPELVQAFGEFKTIWDPDGKMNPGKLVNARRVDENLRLGTGYHPRQDTTKFPFPGDDKGSFARATLRCVGVGECRRLHGGTMCPSFMVTREEKHSTRGRARLLFEMLQGEVITDGWKSEAVREALDLCLACKGCKGECPVNVDMATYKAEFLSHYYAKRLRPRHAYAFGLIARWARLAEHAPAVANFLTQAPGLRTIARRLAGIAPQRRLPAFAAHTFKQQFARRQPRNTNGERVILWPDTFNNHFHPETAMAAVAVLESAGYTVDVPRHWLCCGRPLYDYGMLSTAKRWLGRILAGLQDEIVRGTPIIGLEPSCVAVFRDELWALFPDDDLAARLSRQTYLLSEFLVQRAGNFRPPRFRRTAVVHGHCHHKAIMKMGAEVTLLNQLGLDFELLDSGCCGMAGAFGFERDHYDVSIKCGERVLLPAVRGARPDTLIIADGFSCREQIAQTTGRHALHIAEVLELALRAGDEPLLNPPAPSYDDNVPEGAPGGSAPWLWWMNACQRVRQ
ncbi:MAG TPA: FAD-linked oxidase C-terminal domain-containing protein [Gemmatimonadaceae bacterium]|jgi:FAD/FMN-containing dehydrogenase/Fe-S oxidoreductase